MSKRYKQTESYYRDLMLGFGSGSVYNFGCFLVSFVNGLSKFGYNFTPRTFNQFLKDNNAWTGEFRNYIDVDKLDNILPDIFVSYKRIDPCPEISKINWYLTRGYIVIAKVSAKGIGGTGSHFVFVEYIKDGVAWIYDPWHGDLKPVTYRYGGIGNLLSLRVFGIKRLSTEPTESENMTKEPRESRDHYWNVLVKIAGFLGIQLKSEDDVDQLVSKVEDLKNNAEKTHGELRQEIENRVEQVGKLDDRLRVCSDEKKDLEIKLNEAIESVNVVEVPEPSLVIRVSELEKSLELEQLARDEADKAKGRALNEVARIKDQLSELEKKNSNLLKKRTTTLPATQVLSALWKALWAKLKGVEVEV